MSSSKKHSNVPEEEDLENKSEPE
jgi:ESF2/ABP1 family protein